MTNDHELDDLLRVARSRFLARADASFDFAAGLADVYERASMRRAAEVLEPRQRKPRRRPDDGGAAHHRTADGG